MLRQLPPDVLDSNILQKLSPADLRSLRESSPAAAELVRDCKSALALSRQALPAAAGVDVSTEVVAKVLAAYAAVSALKLDVKSANEALELLVIASCTKLFTVRSPGPLRCAFQLHAWPPPRMRAHACLRQAGSV